VQQSRCSHRTDHVPQGHQHAAVATRAYREALHTIRTVSTASRPMIVVAIVSVDQVNSRLAGSGAAIAQWPTVFVAPRHDPGPPPSPARRSPSARPPAPQIGEVTSRWPPTSNKPVEGPTGCPVSRPTGLLVQCR
jgi:hypothetical protein